MLLSFGSLKSKAFFKALEKFIYINPCKGVSLCIQLLSGKWLRLDYLQAFSACEEDGLKDLKLREG